MTDETTKALIASLAAQTAIIGALVATHPDRARLGQVFEYLADRTDQQLAHDGPKSGMFLAAADEIRKVLYGPLPPV
jgi:hypothetical protein